MESKTQGNITVTHSLAVNLKKFHSLPEEKLTKIREKEKHITTLVILTQEKRLSQDINFVNVVHLTILLLQEHIDLKTKKLRLLYCTMDKNLLDASSFISWPGCIIKICSLPLWGMLSLSLIR